MFHCSYCDTVHLHTHTFINVDYITVNLNCKEIITNTVISCSSSNQSNAIKLLIFCVLLLKHQTLELV